LLAQKVEQKGQSLGGAFQHTGPLERANLPPASDFFPSRAKAQRFTKKSAGGLVAQANRLPFLHALPRDSSSLRFGKRHPMQQAGPKAYSASFLSALIRVIRVIRVPFIPT
jgi:hypothetical protein